MSSIQNTGVLYVHIALMPALKMLCNQISRGKLLPSLANIDVRHGIEKIFADICTYKWETEAQSEVEDELLQQNEVCASYCCRH